MHEETVERERWGILARKSKVLGEADARRELSTDAQIAQGRRAAEREGADVPSEFIWTELGSAFKARQRDEFEAALAALAAGEINTLWCYDLSRFSRKGADDLIGILRPGKGRVIFDYDGLDSSNPRDRRWIINRAEEAREYSERLSANVKNTKRLQRDSGKWLSASSYGYTVHPKTRKLHQDRSTEAHETCPAAVVFRIFTETAEGGVENSLRKITARLNSDGIPGPAGGTWNVTAVYRIALHPVYEGWQILSQWPAGAHAYVYRDKNGERISVTDEPIVSAELAARARASVRKSKNPAFTGALPQPTAAAHTLTGLPRCAGCYGSSQKTAGAWMCGKHRRSPGSCPAPVSLDGGHLDPWVIETWKSRLASLDTGDEADMELAMAITARWSALQAPEETADATAARRALAEAEAALQDLVDGRYKRKEFEGPMRRLYQPMLDDALSVVSAAKENADQYSAGPLVCPFIGDRELVDEAWETTTQDTRRALLALAINCVVIRRRPDGPMPNRWTPLDVTERAEIYWHGDPLPPKLAEALKRRRGGRRKTK
ncbi:recombinase family protein [Streptomyces sp. NBC_00328]|uniref:recombinase family protein n=1 Tax=Streptomyces sp. NBC_00328 TaxID=2903646 RepID=UPI002E2AA3C1|nr:recombinase family protein [Streptomyces sp. NBC_00328]